MQWDGEALAAKWEAVVGEELFDHTLDDGMSTDFTGDDINIVTDPRASGVKAQLTMLLQNYVQRAT